VGQAIGYAACQRSAKEAGSKTPLSRVKGDLKNAALHLDCGVRRLIQQARIAVC
jgi:hypothetical protein